MTTVGKRLYEAGMRKVLADPGRDAETCRRWAAGESLRAIAAAVGMSRSGVEGAVERLWVEGRRRRD